MAIGNKTGKSTNKTDQSRRLLLRGAASLFVAGMAAPSLLNSGSASAAPVIKGKLRAAVVYFSRTGNTRFLAEETHRMVDGALIEVKTVEPYPENYRATTRKAKIEQENNARPEITVSGSIDDFDYVFIGYPNWWGTIPMALFTYLEQVNTENKTIIPFCTHEGSHLGSSVRDIRHLCPASTILEGHAQRGGDLGTVSSDRSISSLHRWINELSV